MREKLEDTRTIRGDVHSDSLRRNKQRCQQFAVIVNLKRELMIRSSEEIM